MHEVNNMNFVKWFKIKEKLPSENKRVLVLDYEQTMYVGWIYCDSWFYDGQSNYDEGHIEAPTHWAQLPELPYELD